MKTIVLIGPQQVGKSTLANLLEGLDNSTNKTVVPEYKGNILDTPGEYIEHRHFYGRFQVLVSEYPIVGIVIPCLFNNIYIPPNFISMFPNKKHIGIITKTDLGTEKDIKKCEEVLKDVGITEIYKISMYDQKSIDHLTKQINRYIERLEQ
ncbi:MAG: EutP/PduV family microcompartment system protein [Brevinema sp.]